MSIKWKCLVLLLHSTFKFTLYYLIFILLFQVKLSNATDLNANS